MAELNESDETIYGSELGVQLNISTNISDNYVPYERRPETYVLPILFAILFIMGLLGNGTIVLVFLRNKSMRTIPNTYIISLSIGDLLIITGALPFVSTIYTFESWPYGEFVCKLSEFLRDVSIGVTVFTLTTLSADRYMAIVLPLKRFTSNKHKELTLMITAGIWCLAMILALPGAINSFLWWVQVSPNKSIPICYPFPQNLGPNYPKLIVLTKFLLLYAIPLLVITFFYLLMARHLINSSKGFSSSSSGTRASVALGQSHVKQIQARAKVAKIVLSFILLFAVCLFPSHVFMLWFYFYPDSTSNYTPFWHYWRIVGFVLTFGNSCLNPVALYLVSGSFRTYFKRYLFRCSCKPAIRIKSMDGNNSIHSSIHKQIASSSRSSKSSKDSNSTSFNKI